MVVGEQHHGHGPAGQFADIAGDRMRFEKRCAAVDHEDLVAPPQPTDGDVQERQSTPVHRRPTAPTRSSWTKVVVHWTKAHFLRIPAREWADYYHNCVASVLTC